MKFSLFFFDGDGASAAAGSYDLLLESAKFADAHGLTAVWTPERHFHAFGGSNRILPLRVQPWRW